MFEWIRIKKPFQPEIWLLSKKFYGAFFHIAYLYVDFILFCILLLAMFLLNSVWLKTWRRFFCKLYTVENSTVEIQFPLKKKTIKKKKKSKLHLILVFGRLNIFLWIVDVNRILRWEQKISTDEKKNLDGLFNAKNVVFHKKRGSKILHCFLNMYGSAMVSVFDEKCVKHLN